ncbi:unnamed protein product [Amoebophrya sp. A120]|nr:unnamed protein product [Amoebophrya sp. A120]CAD7975325.1 unnamed protein product [Amoebophrya sp. A120]|eukprot:GSA120T00025315001.1
MSNNTLDSMTPPTPPVLRYLGQQCRITDNGLLTGHRRDTRARFSLRPTDNSFPLPPPSQDGESARQVHKFWLFCMTTLGSKRSAPV